MKLGENILRLRKKQGLSQEQLGEKIDVTRQTISNWELGETSPNPEQLKLLSKLLMVSVDELLDNEIKSILEEKVSNTERLAGIIIKILKIVGVFITILFIIDFIVLIFFAASGKLTSVESSATTICKIDNKKYQIEFGSNDYFECADCSSKMKSDLKKLTDFNDMDKSLSNIKNYFLEKNGTCD